MVGLAAALFATPARATIVDSTAAARHTTDALAQAAALDTPVTVDDATTPYELTQALPTGELATTFSAEPVRVRQDGEWVPTDTTLVANEDGTYSPAAVLGPVTISGGGSGPLAVLDNNGTSLSLSWPTPLPPPVVSGSAATYPEVLPGVDLQVTTDSGGSLSDLLVVKSAAAADNPDLAALTMEVSSSAGPVTADGVGGLRADAQDGSLAFHAARPLMWDAGADANNSADSGAANAAPALTDDPVTDPVSDVPAGPPPSAEVAPVDVDVDGGTMTLSPNMPLLTGDDTNYPVTIDPNWVPWKPNADHFAWAQEALPGTAWYDTTSNGNPAVGYQGWQPSYQGRNRSFWQFSISRLQGETIHHAELDAKETYSGSWGCTSDDRRQINAASTDVIGPNTTWNHQPDFYALQDTRMVGGSKDNCGFADDPVIPFDVTSAVQADRNNDNIVTFRLAADAENDKMYYKRFAGYKTQLYVEYNSPPKVPTNLSIGNAGVALSAPFCNGDPTPWYGATVGNGFTLSADVKDPDGDLQQVHALFRISDRSADGGPTDLVGYNDANSRSIGDAPGTGGTVKQNYGITLHNGHRYGFAAKAEDGPGDRSGETDMCFVAVDTQAPTQPDVSSDDFKLAGSTKHINQQGTFLARSQDPDPPNGTGVKSLIDHFIWSTVSASALDNDGGRHVAWETCPGGGEGRCAEIPFIPRVWGINYLYVAAVDGAGNESEVATYEFYAPDDPTLQVTPGDVNGGDGHPDVLATDAESGNLILLPTRNDSLPATPVVVSDGANSPNENSWANALIAHRTSLSATLVDDLWAKAPGARALYVYLNNRNNVGNIRKEYTRDQDAVVDVPRPDCGAGTSACANYRASCSTSPPPCDWSNVEQLIAPGDMNGDSRPDLLTVEPGSDGTGELWFFPGRACAGCLGPATLVANTGTIDWNNWRVLAPGDLNGDGKADLMAAPSLNASTNELRLWPVTSSVDGSGDPIITLGAKATNDGPNWEPDGRRLITSPADIDDNGLPELYSVYSGGTTEQLWANSGTTLTDDTYNVTTHLIVDDGTGNYHWSAITSIS